MKTEKFAKLLMFLAIAALALGGLGYGLFTNTKPAEATTAVPGYDIVLPQDAPVYGRAAPYGQWIVTHNSVSGITTTENYGTVARTNGYDDFKSLICYNSGAYSATINLYLRTTSTGSMYTLVPTMTTIAAATRQVITFTDIAPWMSVGVHMNSYMVTGTTMLCGIYVQTP